MNSIMQNQPADARLHLRGFQEVQQCQGSDGEQDKGHPQKRKDLQNQDQDHQGEEEQEADAQDTCQDGSLYDLQQEGGDRKRRRQDHRQRQGHMHRCCLCAQRRIKEDQSDCEIEKIETFCHYVYNETAIISLNRIRGNV